jgi:dTDP-4-amino-4,6-dideoxygalactose transaminase
MNPGRRRIPIMDLKPEIDEHWDELIDALEGVLRSGRFILGPNVIELEKEVATYLGVQDAVGVNSGTDALMISLRASGIEPGDEVITTPFTFFATAEAISNIGATPVFVDIDPSTFNIDPVLIEEAINERTRAILPVHLFGQPCEMDTLGDIAERHRIKVIEDVAQSMGASYRGRKVGGFGEVAALSFFPSKTLGAFGDGGMVATDQGDIAEAARMLRAHGSRERYVHEVLGFNSRLDELQAAVLRIRLRDLDHANARRRSAAARYRAGLSDGLADLVLPDYPDGDDCVYHQFTVRILNGRRDEAQRFLASRGIESRVYYPIPSSALPVFAASSPPLPEAERAALEVLSLPIGPSIPPGDQDSVIEALFACLG